MSDKGPHRSRFGRFAPTREPAATLAAFIRRHSGLFVLTGAGVSTDSGIPDYRDQEGRWKQAEPIRIQPFLHDPAARRRYWARSFTGWPRVAAAEPNDSHRCLAALERCGLANQLVTQNVDGLLRAAELGLPIAILNLGRTRADHLAALKLDADCADTLNGALPRLIP